MKKIFAFTALVLLLSACGDSEEINYSGKYVSTSVKALSVRMFTKKGEVKKSGVIQAFLPEDIATDFFIFSNPPDVSGQISVEFLEDRQVNLMRDGNVELRTRTNKKGILYLEASESGTIITETNPVFPFGDLGKYKPLHMDTTLISHASGFKYYIEFKDCVFLQPQGSEIRIPVFSYYLHRNYGLSISGYAARQNNAFNKDIVKKLAATDTLVVQEGYILLREL